jgi:predicted transglutaminase-like cysteine proteinase
MRRPTGLLLSIAAFLSLSLCGQAQAGLFSLPRVLKPQLERITLDAPVLGPMAHVRFCLQYPADCMVHKIAFRGGRLKLTPQRVADLEEVNRTVNQGIAPERNLLGVNGEKWLISPASGDCNDYAVTKRHELLARGWPSRTLLLAEVAVPDGEHHLVVVVRTAQGDFVLDNLNPTIKPWSKVPYRWVRVQRPSNPLFWSTVRQLDV